MPLFPQPEFVSLIRESTLCGFQRPAEEQFVHERKHCTQGEGRGGGGTAAACYFELPIMSRGGRPATSSAWLNSLTLQQLQGSSKSTRQRSVGIKKIIQV